MSSEVKWLYPGADKESLKETDSEGTDQSIQGDSQNPSLVGDSCSSTNSAPSSPLEELGVPVEQLTNTVNAASSYVGSLWGGWGKKATEKKENNENEATEANDSRKGSMTGGLGMMSSAFGKLSSFSKTSPVDHDQKTEAENKGEEKESGGYFSAASLGAGLTSLKSSLTMENLYSATGATTAVDKEEKEGEDVPELEGE